jgi:N-acetyl-gamma-glutamyl-phosphate reductase
VARRANRSWQRRVEWTTANELGLDLGEVAGMIRVGVLGATGYTALELIKILLRHQEVEIAALTSRQEGGPHVAAVHPQLAGRLDMHLEDLEPSQVAARCDCIFSCLPHGASASVVSSLLDAGKRVVDFSADYRLTDVNVYAEWYGQKHVDADRVQQAVYGLPEIFGPQIPDAKLVANPGCYPTSAILALAPLLRAELIEPQGIIVDSKSGVSGAGRTPKLMTHYPECNESLVAYNVGRHRHTPEIDQVLSSVSGKDVQVVFTPHLVPMDRGILTTAYAGPRRDISEESLLGVYREFYEGKPFVRVVEHLPATKDVSGSNFCDVTARLVRGRLVIFSCVDNLIKGASGAAVQNFNLMYGFPETTAF